MKRHTLYFITILIAASLILGACAQSAATPGAGQEKIKVRVATDATWPPFEQVNESTKEIEGFDIDLFKAVAEKAGLELEFNNVAFDPLLAGVAQCQYDAAISAITITDERKQSMLFSDPYFAAGQVVTVNTNNTDINGKDDLAGKTVGAQIGTTGAIEIEKIEGATLKTYDEVGLAYQDLINGQIDAVVADNPLAIGYVAQNPDTLKTVGEVFTDENYGIAICKDKADLQAKINEGLAAVKAEGTIDQLTEKWLGDGE